MVVITVGNFDGVHVGHQALLARARGLAGPSGRVVALVFDPHPSAVLRPGAEPARLTAFDHRAALLIASGANEVERLEPTPALLGLSPEEFVRAKVDRFRPAHWVEGEDFHFGKARAGSVRTLEQLGLSLGFNTHVVPPVEAALSDHSLVTASSTITRWLLRHGRVRDAARVLGRPYELRGVVVQGDRRGRSIGFPTANLRCDTLLPAEGVYAGLGFLPDGRALPAAINIGTRPTFEGVGTRAEVHLIASSAPSAPPPWAPLPGIPEYGWPLRVQLLAWLRDDVRFESVPALIDQIRRDCARALDAVSPDLARAS